MSSKRKAGNSTIGIDTPESKRRKIPVRLILLCRESKASGGGKGLGAELNGENSEKGRVLLTGAQKKLHP